MFWLSRPPYLRWAVAAAIVIGALLWDLRPPQTEPFPFAAVDIEQGEAIDDAAVEWRETPRGLLAAPAFTDPYAARRIAAEEPITASAVVHEAGVPAGWWAVSIPLPAAALPGAKVRLVLFDPAMTVDGVVVAAAAEGTFTLSESGLVAVPNEHAEAVGRAAAENALTVLVEP